MNKDISDMNHWQSEDFLDADSENPMIDDPWTNPTNNLTSDRANNPNPYKINETKTSTLKKISDDKAYQEPTDSDIWDIENNHSNEDFEYSYDLYDEPEPLAEYDEDLSEPVYVSDVDEVDFRAVRIDKFIANVDEISSEQRTKIEELLGDLSQSRLGRWLPWLQRHSWTGHSLLLFLEFRFDYWEQTSQWWECSFWSWRISRWWWPEPNPGALNLDATYSLVQARLHFPADEVIDEAWLAEWVDFEMWKRGFPSFAGFALFRAEIADREDWQDSLNAYETNAQDAADSSDSYTPFDQNELKKCWFAIQDWYDPSEWHDNLGWPEIWISGTSAYSIDTDASDLHMWAPDMSSYFSDSEEEADSAK